MHYIGMTCMQKYWVGDKVQSNIIKHAVSLAPPKCVPIAHIL